MKFKNLFFVATFLLTTHALAYEFAPGKLFLKGVVGPSVNFLRFNDETANTTPGAGLMLGLEAEYVLSKPWSLTAGMRPVFAPGFIDLGFGIGGKYRWDGFDVPLNVFAGLELTPAWLIPLSSVDGHFNIGLRASGGVDYFVMNNLVIGAQVSLEPSVLWTKPYQSFEMSVECLLGVMYKF